MKNYSASVTSHSVYTLTLILALHYVITPYISSASSLNDDDVTIEEIRDHRVHHDRGPRSNNDHGPSEFGGNAAGKYKEENQGPIKDRASTAGIKKQKPVIEKYRATEAKSQKPVKDQDRTSEDKRQKPVKDQDRTSEDKRQKPVKDRSTDEEEEEQSFWVNLFNFIEDIADKSPDEWNLDALFKPKKDEDQVFDTAGMIRRIWTLAKGMLRAFWDVFLPFIMSQIDVDKTGDVVEGLHPILKELNVKYYMNEAATLFNQINSNTKSEDTCTKDTCS